MKTNLKVYPIKELKFINKDSCVVANMGVTFVTFDKAVVITEDEHIFLFEGTFFKDIETQAIFGSQYVVTYTERFLRHPFIKMEWMVLSQNESYEIGRRKSPLRILSSDELFKHLL